ncbi:uncharacterized protein LOC143242790 isoform X1 [Tachypleus tridentatus]|uniref:uncharacterized protein LOC143242790 isoform X1 n=1 Tax=Tachypleus tridentatus TaxID=6853 RepID=UPI003FD65938
MAFKFNFPAPCRHVSDAEQDNCEEACEGRICTSEGKGSSPAWQYAEQLHGPSTSFIPDIPPLPPFPLDDDGVTDDKALASMLMLWYMSGYHTSNYQCPTVVSKH